ncbi:MAG: DNA-formamidopyrimidine glycosylase family protein [Acidimicrobiales bacterium]
MPEGDTIRRLADRIAERFAGQTCTRCVTRDPRLVGLDLTGDVLRDADAVGKHLFLRFESSEGRRRTVHAHLLMDGRFVVGPASKEHEWRRRLELWFDDGRLTGLDVPLLGVVPTEREHELVDHLGPDLCGAVAPDPVVVASRLQRDPDVPLAGALLDQRNAAGFGNVYAVELPFVVGVSPNQPVGGIDGLDGLLAIGIPMIRQHAAKGPRNTTGRRLGTADHFVYGRQSCPVCATPLKHWTDRDSPWGRISAWCPACQRVDERRSVDLGRARKLLALHPVRRDPMFPAVSADR